MVTPIRRKPGPKPLKPGAIMAGFRLTETDHALLVAIATHDHTTMTAVIERLIREEAKRLKVKPAKETTE